MILRNPSHRRDFFFWACLFLTFFFFHKSVAQGVNGIVTDISGQPVDNAIISIIHANETISVLSADQFGAYAFYTNEAKRIRLAVAAGGFHPYMSEEIILDGYSTLRLNPVLESDPYILEGVTVIASRRKAEPYLHSITKNDLNTIAGNFDDPVRVAVSKPGIVQINDQANHISVRGVNPIFNSWYLEGLEIVNPNHTNNAGIFSDMPALSGGGINMFSAQTLGSTDIYTGLNPLTIGRSAGAVIDMHLHESAKPEFRAKAGLLGFELGGGKTIGENGILDLNLRYSFTGLLANMGVDFGGEKIGFYDAVLSYRYQGIKSQLKVFGWTGRSENEFDRVEDPNERMRYKDFFNIDYTNDIAGAGIKYRHIMSNITSLHAGAAYSILRPYYVRQGGFSADTFSHGGKWLGMEILSSFLELNFNHTPKFQSLLAVQYIHRSIDHRFLPFVSESVIRPYVNGVFHLSQKITLEAGGEINHNFYHTNSVPGYRALAEIELRPNHNIHAGLRHAAGQVVLNDAATGESIQLLIDKYEVGWTASGKHGFSLDIYYQVIDKLPVFLKQDGFNHSADNTELLLLNDVLNDVKGKGVTYGIEGEWEFTGRHGWNVNANQTVYESTRNYNNGDLTDGRYAGGFATHVSIAKEIIKVKKEKNRIWNFSLRGIIHGGLWEESIDIERSDDAAGTVFLQPGIFDVRLPAYKRIDAGIARTIANQKIRWRYALDIQNLLGFTNIAYHYYDPFLQQIQRQEQLGIIPVLSIQASW